MNRQSGPAKEKRDARSEIKLSCGFLVSFVTFVFSALPLLRAVVL